MCIRITMRQCPLFILKDAVLETPLRKLTQEEVDAMGLKYYDSDVHKAAFTLPQFVKTVSSYTVQASYVKPVACVCFVNVLPVILIHLSFYRFLL